MKIALTVNGERREADVWGGESLLFALREQLGLPGSKNACEQGECGSCSVLLDGDARLLLPRPRRAGRRPRGRHRRGHRLGRGSLHRVQEAFVDAGAVQCGFCTPGLIVATVDLLDAHPEPVRRRDPRGALGQPLPLHRLPEDLRRGAGRGAAHDDRPTTTDAEARGRRIGEVVRAAGRRRRRCSGEFAYSSDLSAAGHALGPHAAQPARARARRRDRHLAGGDDARCPRRAHARRRARAARPTGSSSPTSRCSRSTASATTASRSRSSRRSIPSRRAARPRRSRVEYEPLEPVVDPERATEQEPLHPDRPTMGHGYRDDPRPNVVRSMVIRHGDPDVEGDVTVEGVYELGSQDQAFLGPESGLAIPDGEGGIDIHVATQWLHVDRDQVAPCLGARARAGADPPRRRRRRVRGPRGPLDADPRRDARAPHRPAGEDRLQPRGVVHRPRPPAPGADLGRASRDARRPPRLRAHEDPPRRRRVRLELDRGDLERLGVRARARTASTTR